MSEARKMNFKNETISGSQGSVYAEIEGKRIVFANLKKFKAKMGVNITKGGVLGLTGKQSKAGGWEGTWEASMYYNMNSFRKLAVMYKDTGILPMFNIQVINEDKATINTLGRQSVTFIDCISEDVTLALIDVDAETLEEDLSGTFNDFKYNEHFADTPTA